MSTIERIFALMESSGVKAVELSKATSVSTSVISSWKKGLQKPSTEAIIRIAAFFGVSTDYLHGVTDDPRPRTAADKKSASEEIGDTIRELLIQAGYISPHEELTDEKKDLITNLFNAAITLQKLGKNN